MYIYIIILLIIINITILLYITSTTYVTGTNKLYYILMGMYLFYPFSHIAIVESIV